MGSGIYAGRLPSNLFESKVSILEMGSDGSELGPLIQVNAVHFDPSHQIPGTCQLVDSLSEPVCSNLVPSLLQIKSEPISPGNRHGG